jgi:hypothetical protein
MAKKTVKWNEYRHVAWSAGYCTHCQGLEAIRVQDVVEVLAVYFVPIQRRVVGRNGICDFCERPLDRAVTDQLVDRLDWAPPGGLPKLLASLGSKQELTLPEAPLTETQPDVRLRSLLSATQDASSLKNVNIVVGLVAGLIAGVALGIPLGMVLFDHGIRLGPDRFGTGFAVALIGAVVGSIAGATVYGLMIRTRTATRKVVAACGKYPLDLARLGELARDYNRHVQHAVNVATLERRG